MKEHKWLQEVNGVQMFLPDMARSYLLVYFQKLSVPHTMSWHVTKEQDGVAVGNFDSISAYQDGPSRSIISLLPDKFNKDPLLVKFLGEPTLF